MAVKKKPGPEPERLVISGDWKSAVGRALKKERPAEGWPSEPKPKKKPKAKRRKAR